MHASRLGARALCYLLAYLLVFFLKTDHPFFDLDSLARHLLVSFRRGCMIAEASDPSLKDSHLGSGLTDGLGASKVVLRQVWRPAQRTT